MSGPPAQGYKMSGEGNAGGGSDGSTGMNTTGAVSGGATAQKPESTGPPQDIAGTLPNDFKLSNTKAESKGDDHQETFAHDVDTPENKPSFARQANDSSKVPNGPAM